MIAVEELEESVKDGVDALSLNVCELLSCGFGFNSASIITNDISDQEMYPIPSSVPLYIPLNGWQLYTQVVRGQELIGTENKVYTRD